MSSTCDRVVFVEQVSSRVGRVRRADYDGGSIRTGSLHVWNSTKNGSNACARTDQCWGTSKNVRNRGVSDVAAWLRTGGDDDPLTTYRQVSLCRLYLGRVMPSFFSVLEELALPRS